jgi:hypothetical protein
MIIFIYSYIMLDTRILLVIIVVVIVLYRFFTEVNNTDENFSGALMQLYAKGSQDLYLTVDTEKYVPELWWPYSPYANPYNPYFFWNMSTRRASYPHYIHMHDHLFPYYY